MLKGEVTQAGPLTPPGPPGFLAGISGPRGQVRLGQQ